LDSIQNRCLRICSGAINNTPTSYLEVECGVLPLFLQRKQILLKYIARTLYYKLPNSYLQKDWKYYYGKYKNNNQPIIDKVKFFEQYNKTDIAQYPISPVPPWFLPNLQVDLTLCNVGKKDENTNFLLTLAKEKIDYYKDYFHIYTDGSKNESNTSCSFYVPSINFHKSYKLRSTSIYCAELFAILQAILWVEDTKYKHVLILSDSLSSLNSIKSKYSNCNPSILLEILLCAMRLVATDINVQFIWIPSHIGITGNEIVDKHAKEALKLHGIVTLQHHLNDIYSDIKYYIRNLWQKKWSNVDTEPFYKTIEPKVSLQIKFSEKHRKKEVILTRLRFNYTALNSNLFKMNLHKTGFCQQCFSTEDPKHVFMDCIFNQQFQFEIVNNMYKQKIPITYENIIIHSRYHNKLYQFVIDNNINIVSQKQNR
jgi:ribonuclease HI